MIDLRPLIAASQLSLESWWWSSHGAYVAAQEPLGFSSPMAYALALSRLIDSPLGDELDPATCRRLRAKRERGSRSRSSRLSA